MQPRQRINITDSPGVPLITSVTSDQSLSGNYSIPRIKISPSTQINGTEQKSPEINPCVFGQFIYDKKGKNIQWGNTQSLQ